jgi:cell division septal protein FtsQ
MRRRFKRSKPRWGPVFALLLAVNLTLALLFSPLTAIRRVRIEGAPDWDRDRLESLVQGLKGVPCAQINAYRVESDAMQEPQVRSAHFARNLFGSAVLEVGYRQPVAVLAGEPGVAISIEGVPFQSGHLPPDLPVVKIDGEGPVGMRTLAETWPVVSVARLAVKAGIIFRGQSLSIELGKGNSVCLNMGAGQVVLGSCNDIDAKLAALEKLLAQKPALLSEVQSLNLSVPTSPSAVPRSAGVKK